MTDASDIPPMPQPPERDFTDSIAHERQDMKDWIRKELYLLNHGMSLEDRRRENP